MARCPIRSVAAAAALAPTLWLGGLAEAQRASSPPVQAPPADRIEPAPDTPADSPTAKAPAVDPSEAPATGSEQSLVGLAVFSSDGTRVGDVRAVSKGPGGDVVALLVRTGGFLGFGGRTVAIPQGRFTRTGQSVRLDLASDQVNDLPEIKE